jgi:hypothetical protein
MSEQWDAVTLSDYGGGNSTTIPVIGAQASWELNAAGTFSAFTTPEAMAEAGRWGPIAGAWVIWSHPTAGQWGGVAIGKPATHGVTEIAAEGFAVLMRGRGVESTPRLDELTGTAGGAIRRAFGAVFDGVPLFVTRGMWDESGDPAILAVNTRDLYADVLGSAAGDGDTEWYVDAQRRLFFGQSLGVDRTASVVLIEDREIVSARLGDDLWAAPASEIVQYEPVAVQATSASILSGGRKGRRKRDRQTSHRAGRKDRHKPGRPVRRLRRTVMTSQPGPAAPSLLVEQDTLPRNLGLTMLSVPKPAYIQIDTLPLELTLVDRNSAFANTQLGDVVRVVIESARFAGQFRVHSRAIDTTQGTMIVAGECLADRVG